MYLICLAKDFSKCVTIAETYQDAIKKFEYWTEVKKTPVTIRYVK